MAETKIGGPARATVHFRDARAPDGMRLYAIGDIHGRRDLLEIMHDAIADELARDAVADWRVIHLGDYTDRGPDSRGVLDFLIDAKRRDPRNIAIAGNHDVALLDFLERPDADSLFVHYGGIQTARSYGVDVDFDDGDWLETLHARFRAAFPPGHADFIRRCGLSTAFGDFFFCHAGIRPGIPLDQQDPEDLIWIREPFLTYPELHPKVVVHGHTISVEPEVLANRVNVDTGAWRSGVLTALVVDGAEKRLLGAVESADGLTS